MEKNDIVFLLSGGVSNTDPYKSVGGRPSNTQIDLNDNNIFNDVSREHASSGYTDYRCFYIANNNEDEKLKNTEVYSRKSLEGSDIELGFDLQNEIQALTLTEKPDSGSFQLFYTIKHGSDSFRHTTKKIIWVADADIMSSRIATALNALDQLGGIEVDGEENEDGFDFLITFAGASGNRSQELLGVINQLEVDIKVSRIERGSPINFIAPNIGMVNNLPYGTNFYDTDKSSSILIGTLFPGDFCPIWVKRIVEEHIKAVHPDTFDFHIIGEPKPANLRTIRGMVDLDSNPLRKDRHLLF